MYKLSILIPNAYIFIYYTYVNPFFSFLNFFFVILVSILSVGVSGDIRHCSSKQIALYKFVRLAGDLLMPSLFVPYVTMLAGLADSPTSAAYCFNLLKGDGECPNLRGHLLFFVRIFFFSYCYEPAKPKNNK